MIEAARERSSIGYWFMVKVQAPVMIPPAMIVTGLWSINKVKKGVEKGLSEKHQGMLRGLNEIKNGVKYSLSETKK